MHQHHVTNHHPQKLLFVSSMTPRTFHTLDCEAPDLDGLTAGRSLPFIVGSGNMAFITSCNGVVCVGITKFESDAIYSDLILWNPSTCEYKTLSKASYHKEDHWVSGRPFGLYHSASEDDYKLLHVRDLRYAYMYSLKSDSWKELEYSKDFKCMPDLKTWGASIILNEKLYFLGKGETGTLRRLSYSIIRFDTKNKNFTKIATPCLGDIATVCLSSTLLEKDRKVHLCVIYSLKADSTELGAKLWRMDGVGDGDWTMVGTYPIPKGFYSYEPLHLMRDGNWLTRCRAGCHAYKLDPARNFKNVSDSDTTRRISIPPRVKYIETLVSPNR